MKKKSAIGKTDICIIGQSLIRTRSHGLRQLAEDKFVYKLSTDLLQGDCQNLLSTGSLHVVSEFNRLVAT